MCKMRVCSFVVTLIFMMSGMLSLADNSIKTATIPKVAYEKRVLKASDYEAVNRSLIPETVKSLKRRSELTKLQNWQGAKAEQGRLVWNYRERDETIQPYKWYVPISKKGKTIGLYALDPATKKMSWRAENIFGKGRSLVRALDAVPAQKIGMTLGHSVAKSNLKNYAPSRIKIVGVHGFDYFMVPSTSNKIKESLFIPVEDESVVYTFGEVDQRRGVIVEEKRSKSPKVRTLKASKKRIGRGGRIRDDAEGAETSSSNVEPSGGYTVAPGASTKMVGELPLFDQKSYPNCWAYSLAILHQWWSPRNLGCSDYQTDLIRYYTGKKTSEGANNDVTYGVMKNWDKVKEKWDNGGPRKITASRHASSSFDSSSAYWGNKTWNDNFDYEDFKTTWKGQGKSIGTYGNTWKSNDLKAWVAMEAPVLASINAYGDRGDGVNHLVVVAGYDDAVREVYIVDPNGFTRSYDYDDFNDDYWGAHYYRKRYWAFGWHYYGHKRRGMVVGMPGDDIFVKVEDVHADIQERISDTNSGHVRNIRMKVAAGGDHAFSGVDTYGDRYRPQVKFRANNGQIHHQQGGNFNQIELQHDGGVAQIGFKSTLSLPPGQSIGGASFQFRLNSGGSSSHIPLNGTFTLYDKDNRSHFQTSETMTVFSDVPAPNGYAQMRKPTRFQSSQTLGESVDVYDDDRAGPTVETISSLRVTDALSTAYRLVFRVRDDSGIASVRCRRRFSSENNFGPWETMQAESGNRYAFTVPRDEWIAQVNRKIYFEVEATDNDNDHANDQRTSNTIITVHIDDDDKKAPELADYSLVKHGHQLTFYVKLEDDSPILMNGSTPSLIYSMKEQMTDAHWHTLRPASSRGENWFKVTFQRPIAQVSLLAYPVYLYWQVGAEDMDDDRPGDHKAGKTYVRKEHVAGPKQPLRVVVNKWERLIQPKPELEYIGRLPERDGVPIPHVIDDLDHRRVGVDYDLSGGMTGQPLELVATVDQVAGGDYYVSAQQVNHLGEVRPLGTFKINDKTKTLVVKIPKESTSAFGNRVVLQSANFPAKPGKSITWKSISIKEQAISAPSNTRGVKKSAFSAQKQRSNKG